jgi:hypothetical protein
VGRERAVGAAGSGHAPGSRGQGQRHARADAGLPRLDFALEFTRLDFGELAAWRAWRGRGRGHAAGRGTQTPFLGACGERWLRAATARLAGLDLQHLTTELQLDRGSVRLRDASFDLYEGRHRGTLALDARADGLPFTLVSRVEGVDVARLLAAWSPGSAGVVRGTGAFDLDLRGVAHAPEVLGTLGGSLRLQVRDGALTTVGLLETVAALLEAAGGRGIGREETPFRALAGPSRCAGCGAHRGLALVAGDRAGRAQRPRPAGAAGAAGVVAFSRR